MRTFTINHLFVVMVITFKPTFNFPTQLEKRQPNNNNNTFNTQAHIYLAEKWTALTVGYTSIYVQCTIIVRLYFIVFQTYRVRFGFALIKLLFKCVQIQIQRSRKKSIEIVPSCGRKFQTFHRATISP